MRYARFRLHALALAPLLVAQSAAAQAPPSRMELERRIDAYLAPLATSGDLSGTVLVARGDSVIYERAFGKLRFGEAAPNTPETPFAVASLTKPLTVIIAAALIDQGRLALGDPLSKWIPDFPQGDRITVEHLLRHRSGIPHRVTAEADEMVPHTAEDMVRFAAGRALAFEPGTSSLYSSAAYSVLARVLEIAGGKPYADLLEEIVLRPAGAAHTANADRPQSGRPSGHFRYPGRVKSTSRNLSFLVGAGSVYSTPRDIFAIMRRLTSGDYGATARTALVRQSGLRWNGITDGFRAFADWDSTTDVTVAFAGNLFTGAADLIRRDMPRVARGEQLDPPVVPTVSLRPIGAAARARLAGVRFDVNPSQPLRFDSDSVALLGDWLLFVTSDSTFFSPQDYATVRVVVGANGEVEALQWGEGPRFARVKE
ncbi:MAG TPA: serine hydrolase domain-containing protein [Gemmatimonadaceae bacterium]|nr:serine hydrolase domain-containing protein [Gemmatimonadaceae bacterium]